MSGRERIIFSDQPPDDESPWWSGLPPNQQMKIIIRGKRLPLPDGLSKEDRRRQAMANTRAVTDGIWAYIKDNDKLFPNFEDRNASKMSGLGILAMTATPIECDALMKCELVATIYPDEELDVELL